MESVCVFCGSSLGASPSYVAAATAVGGEIARRGMTLVYGGASVGLMGAVAEAAMKAGAAVIGVMPQHLVDKEIAHRDVTELRVVETMHERKALMAELAGGFVALPGGYGTLDEIAEMLTWSQLGLHRKPCGLLDVDQFFAPLLAFFDGATTEGFLRPEHRELVLVDDDPVGLLDRMAEWQPTVAEKWIRA